MLTHLVQRPARLPSTTKTEDGINGYPDWPSPVFDCGPKVPLVVGVTRCHNFPSPPGYSRGPRNGRGRLLLHGPRVGIRQKPAPRIGIQQQVKPKPGVDQRSASLRSQTPVVQYLPLRRALTNNVRIRCTWRCQAGAPGDARRTWRFPRCTWGFTGAPGIRLFETGRTCHSQGAPVDCRCTSITPDAPVKIAGAPGDDRCALGMPGAPGIRVFETGRTCHSQGAPVDRRWISITPGASLEYQWHPGRRQGLGLWVSAASQ
jgi:hypothetical protein